MSHLDITRFMQRIIRRAELPLWYTEGFNPHPYITFALPLSLGFESVYEVMDIRLTDDTFDISKIPELLNEITPEYIEFFDCFEPIKKTGKVSAASFLITFDDGGKLKPILEEFFCSDDIPVSKKTKRGNIKEFNAAPHIKDFKCKSETGETKLFLTLPAGGTLNVSPEIILAAFFENNNYYCYNTLRTAILDDEGKLFR